MSKIFTGKDAKIFIAGKEISSVIIDEIAVESPMVPLETITRHPFETDVELRARVFSKGYELTPKETKDEYDPEFLKELREV